MTGTSRRVGCESPGRGRPPNPSVSLPGLPAGTEPRGTIRESMAPAPEPGMLMICDKLREAVPLLCRDLLRKFGGVVVLSIAFALLGWWQMIFRFFR